MFRLLALGEGLDDVAANQHRSTTSINHTLNAPPELSLETQCSHGGLLTEPRSTKATSTGNLTDEESQTSAMATHRRGPAKSLAQHYCFRKIVQVRHLTLKYQSLKIFLRAPKPERSQRTDKMKTFSSPVWSPLFSRLFPRSVTSDRRLANLAMPQVLGSAAEHWQQPATATFLK